MFEGNLHEVQRWISTSKASVHEQHLALRRIILSLHIMAVRSWLFLYKLLVLSRLLLGDWLQCRD